jgi:hypothetical protein
MGLNLIQIILLHHFKQYEITENYFFLVKQNMRCRKCEQNNSLYLCSKNLHFESSYIDMAIIDSVVDTNFIIHINDFILKLI